MVSYLLWDGLSTIRQTYYQELSVAAEHQRKLIASTTAEHLIELDYAMLQDYLDNVTKEYRLAYLQVFDAQQTKIFSYGATQPAQAENIDYTVETVNDGIYDTMEPVTLAGIVLGKVWLGVSLEPINHAINDIKQRSLLVAAFGILLTIIITIIIGFGLTRRLTQLSIAAARVGSGDYHTPLVFGRLDEIGRASVAFNHMMSQIGTQQQELQQHRDNLEKMVFDRTEKLHLQKSKLEKTLQQLQTTQEQLIESEKMSALSSLVTGIAHEINTPIGLSITGITAIQDGGEQLQKAMENRTLTQKALTDYLEHIASLSDSMRFSLEHAADLIRSFKNISVDQHDEVRRCFNLHDYINDVITSFKTALKHTDIHIENYCDPSVVIDSYPGTLLQIISNLITNSLTHGFEGRNSGTITFRLGPHKNPLTLLYDDDGSGIPADILPKIFDPFFSTKRGQGGSGLGLNILYNLVTQKLSGKVTCTSQHNEGVHFCIEIPL